MKYNLLLSILICVVFGQISMGQTRFHNEAEDTLRINAMLAEIADLKMKNSGDNIVKLAEGFLDTPYASNTLEIVPEMVTVNLDELDCTTFVETVMALAVTISEKRTSWRDFAYNLQRLRYRNGIVRGYPSRLHYISDWAVDNIARGNIVEVTKDFPKYNTVVKSINFMSANADKYPALADEATLEAIKNVENGYRVYKYAYIKSGDTGSKNIQAEFKNGDILAFTSNLKNLDVTHMGILLMKEGVPYVIHASSSAGKVVVTDIPLDTFLKRNRQFTGVRVFRLNTH